MIDDKAYHMFIDQALVLLVSIYQTFFTNAVDASRNSGGFTVNVIDGSVCKQIFTAACAF